MKTDTKERQINNHAKAEESPEKFSVMSTLASILKEIAEFKGWELIFQVLMYGFFGWTVYNLKAIYDLHNEPEYAHIPKYSIYDFKFSLIMVLVFMVYRAICKRIFYNFVKKTIKLDKFPTEEEKDARIKTITLWIGSMIYYIFSTSAAFFLFKDQEFFPKILGGPSSNIADIFKGIPSVQNIPYHVTFYMVQFGSHLHTFIDYCISKRNSPKFWEMFLHHSITVFLIFFSYMTGGCRAGILVLFVHDPCDIFIYTNRFVSEMKNPAKVFQIVNYLALIVIWVFFRLYVFPRIIVAACVDYVMNITLDILYSPHLSLTLMLAALVILHFYWFIFIIRVLIGMLVGKRHYNVFDSPKKGEKKE